jgi:SIR2-like domain
VTSELQEADWKRLLRRIQSGKCTPLLGAGACYGALPLGADVAEYLAQRYGYPFPDRNDLVRVAQYAAIQSDPNAPKEDVVDILRAAGPPKYSQPPKFGTDGEPHGVLAGLPFPVVVTTNYDDFMLQAFKWKLKDARCEICRWQDVLRHVNSIFEKEPDYKPTPANPLVFHLHGSLNVSESLVLTEDDYLTFLANIAAKPDLLPGVVQQAFAATSFLFIGYRLGDWNFRVIFQTLRARQQFSSIVVLKPPDETDPNRAAHQTYFEKFYGALDMKIFWGTAREFSSQLEERWGAFKT